MELLTEDEIAGRLAGVPGWARDGSSITSTVTRSDFREAMLYTGAVAYLAASALIALTSPRVTFLIASAGMLTGLLILGPALTKKNTEAGRYHAEH